MSWVQIIMGNWFQNVFLVSSILQKNEWKISTLLLWCLNSNCFRSFLGKLNTKKRHFDIIWPLTGHVTFKPAYNKPNTRRKRPSSFCPNIYTVLKYQSDMLLSCYILLLKLENKLYLLALKSQVWIGKLYMPTTFWQTTNPFMGSNQPLVNTRATAYIRTVSS